MNHPYRHNPMLSTSSSSHLTADGNSTSGHPPPPNGDHPIPTIAIPSNDTNNDSNNNSGNTNALEESILDFSDMESISDFLSVHALRGGIGGGGGGGERDRGYSCSDDDLFTNSDQWSSITNIVNNNNNNPNNNSMNHLETSENNNNSLSNLRSILEPTPEESGRDDSTSITFSPLQPVPHTMINFGGDFNHAPPPPPPPQPLVSSISSPIAFHNNNNNTHLMNPQQQQQQQQFHHTLQQHQNTQDHTNNNNNNNSQTHLHHQNNNNNNSGHFSFMEQASHFPQQNRAADAAAAVVSNNNNMNHYDLTTVSNFQNSNSSLQSTFSGAGMNSDNNNNNNNNDMNLNQSNHQLNSSSNSGMTMHRNTVADTITSTIAATSVYTASTVPVQDPNINDVLLGRGGKNNQWSGNETLRELARTMSTVYSAAPKRNKPSIAMLLVQKIRALSPSGRFLKQEQSVGAWFEVDEEVAREKASQCLRDIVAATTKMKSVTSMVDCNGNINMAMIRKGSKSTTSLRNVSSFAGSKMRTSSSGHGTANATFTSFTAMNPAVVSSSSTATLADRMNHISSSSRSTINTGNQGGLRGSVASFFDNHRNKNESTSNLLSGVKSASRTAAQSGLALLRATPSMTTSGKGGIDTASLSSSATPTVNNQRRISSNVGMDATNSASTSTSGLGNFEWNAKNRSNIFSGSHQQNNDSSHQMSSMSSVSQLQQERPTVPTFDATSGNINTTAGSQSVAARAGLALLQRGSGMGSSNAFSTQQSNPNTASATTSNANMSRVVSNMYSSNNSMRNMIEHQQPSQNLTTSGSVHKLENIGSTNSAMQISSNNLRDMNGEQQISYNAGKNMNYSNIGTHIDTQQQLQSSSRKNSKRNLISASAPNLGDISTFLAKRRRPMLNAQWVNNDEGNSSENASYNVNVSNNDIDDVGNLLDPGQLRDQQIQNGSNIASVGHSRPPPGRAASMITLGANTSSTGGNVIYNSSAVGQNNITNNDQLLQRFQELRSQILTTTASIENLAQKNENVRRLSCVREQQESSMPNVNFHWNNNITGNSNSTIDQSPLPGDNTGNPTTSRSSNMFASLLQQPRIGTAVASLPMATSATSTGVSSNHQPLQPPQQLMNHHTSDMNNYLSTHTSTDAALNDRKNFDCFTGLGEAMGDSDDTALQRWIDHMAEEELS